MLQFKVNDVGVDLESVSRLIPTATDGEQQAQYLARGKLIERFSHSGATFVKNNLGANNPLLRPSA